MPNQFYIEPASPQGLMNGVSAGLKAYGDNQEKQKAEQAQSAKEAEMRDLVQGVQKGDRNSAIKLAAFDPKISSELRSVVGAYDEAEKSSVNNWIAGYMSAEDKDAYLQEDSPLDIDDTVRNMPPEQRDIAARMFASATMDEQMYGAVFGGGEGSQKATAAIQNFTFLDELEDGPRKDAFARIINAEDSIKIKGIEYKKNPLTNKYEAALDATSDVVNNQERALADIEADKKSRIDFATNKTKWKTGKPKYQSKIRSAKNDQKVMTATADEIRKTLDAYSGKYGSLLKGISGSDANKLKGLYQTMLANSAFSTLISLKQAGGTLGAISSSELDLLKAKQGELNQSGQIPEQLRVLDQILSANDRSIKNIEEEFGATESMYSGSFDNMSRPPEKTKEKAVKYSGQNLDAYNWAQSNPDDPRAAAILKKLEAQ